MERCAGMRDLLPCDMAAFREIERAFLECSAARGFQEVRTPVIEYLHLFTFAGTLTPSMLHKVYSFLDWDGWSGERVVLRPDGTVPIARLYCDLKSDDGLAKFAYVEEMFRFQKTQEGQREFWQCGVESIGSDRVEADLEVLELGFEFLSKLGVAGTSVRLSHAGLLKAVLAALGIPDDKRLDAFDMIQDGRASDLEELCSLTDSNKRLLEVFELEGQSSGFVRNVASMLGSDEAVAGCAEELGQITDTLAGLGCEHTISLALAGGFEYYTGTMFEYCIEGQKIGGGGRYDDLVSAMLGRPVPACGLAFGIDRLIGAVGERGRGVGDAGVLVRCVDGTSGALRATFEAAAALRAQGIDAVTDVGYDEQDCEQKQWLLEIRESEGRQRYTLTQQASPKREPQAFEDLETVIASVKPCSR